MVKLGGSTPSRAASSLMGMGRAAIRRNALIFPKLRPDLVTDFPSALVVQHQIGHRLPHLAGGTFATGTAPSSCWASFEELGVDRLGRAPGGGPGPRRGRDQAEHQHDHARIRPGPTSRPGWPARSRGSSPFCREADTSEPTTATPRVWPIWRDVEAMAAATPAWARGMPETAALVIGALTKPKPMPKITYAANSQVNGVVALSPTSMRHEANKRGAGDDQGNPSPPPADRFGPRSAGGAWSSPPWAGCRSRPAAGTGRARLGGRGC